MNEGGEEQQNHGERNTCPIASDDAKPAGSQQTSLVDHSLEQRAKSSTSPPGTRFRCTPMTATLKYILLLSDRLSLAPVSPTLLHSRTTTPPVFDDQSLYSPFGHKRETNDKSNEISGTSSISATSARQTKLGKYEQEALLIVASLGNNRENSFTDLPSKTLGATFGEKKTCLSVSRNSLINVDQLIIGLSL